MNTAINTYLKMVGKKLNCLPETKKMFLLGIKNDLTEYPVDVLTDFQSIERCYGKTEDTAEMLMETVSAEEKAKAQRRKNITKWVCIGVGIILIAAALCIYIDVLNNMPYLKSTEILKG